ncbi:MAG: replication initiation protein [Actinomycetota bacterium]|nr:replication initiation protein [Actinomycetota bacterium]
MRTRVSRAERARMPLAQDVVLAAATDHGVCIRPLPVRRIDLHTGEATVVPVPCGATLASKCPPCAERARTLRMAQCREGWHLDTEPLPDADEPDAEQKALAELRADLTAALAEAQRRGDAPRAAELAEAVAEADSLLAAAGVRGTVAPGRKEGRRSRSTRRRQDAPDLPRRPVENRTVGRSFIGRDGTVWRPSTFLTLTCDTYGRVRSDGTPVDPAAYDYRRAARDAIHFAALVDRFWQNLRRCVGYDVQYFACVEPQKRLAPHLHAAVRGTMPRTLVHQVAAATYHQVWWPRHDQPVYEAGGYPVWDHDVVGYVDPATGAVLTAWDDALDAIGEDDEPAHVVRFGPQVRVDGVVGDSEDSRRCIGYLTKYLTKSLDECHAPDTAAQKAHVDRMAEALRYEPCSPTCANWLAYGVQPEESRPGLTPGHCKGKAHKRATLGFGGRRVLVSRKWSGKNLADHRAERRQYVLATLGGVLNKPGTRGPDDEHSEHAELSAVDAAERYAWEVLKPDDPDAPPRAHLVLHALAERVAWRAQYRAAQALADGTASRPTRRRQGSRTPPETQRRPALAPFRSQDILGGSR